MQFKLKVLSWPGAFQHGRREKTQRTEVRPPNMGREIRENGPKPCHLGGIPADHSREIHHKRLLGKPRKDRRVRGHNPEHADVPNGPPSHLQGPLRPHAASLCRRRGSTERCSAHESPVCNEVSPDRNRSAV